MAYKVDSEKFEPTKTNKTQATAVESSNLKDYGIDFSQEQQDAIANIFRQSATGAYQQAQNQYATDMANQQATLSDTIRRSQAEAVATGASRGLQAANELSATLGLQQAAAEGSTKMQGDYAAALAQAQQQAAELQNQQNQTGAQIFGTEAEANANRYQAELSAEAQKYAANAEYAANDFMRIFNELSAAQNSNPYAEAMLKAYLAANGVPADQLNSIVNNATGNRGTISTGGSDGYVEGVSHEHGSGHTYLDLTDLSEGDDESGYISYGGNHYYVEVAGASVNNKTASALNSLYGNNNPGTGALTSYKGDLYFSVDGSWHKIKGDGSGASPDSIGGLDSLKSAIKGQ